MLNWLHISDLHAGEPSASAVWTAPQSAMLQDLAKLHERCGPWQLLVVSGDLTHSGAPAEFEQAAERIESLRQHLVKLGSPVQIVMVPGNHDFHRAALDSQECAELGRLSTLELFCQQPDHPLAQAVARAFAPFRRFAAAFAQPAQQLAGVLPGDFCQTLIDKTSQSELRVGLVGLNTSCRAAIDGLGPRSGSLDAPQLSAACGNDLLGWQAAHHLTLLVTHHAPRALLPTASTLFETLSSAQDCIHLCGHLGHGAAAEPGLLQAPSLHGRKTWGQAQPRMFGYLAARLQVDLASQRGVLQCWPRRIRRTAEGWRVAAEHSFGLDPDESYSQPRQLRRLPADAPAFRPRAPAVPRPSPRLGRQSDPSRLFPQLVDMASPQATERTETRKLLNVVLPTDSDFEAFCQDYFPWVYSQFANGMDRTQKYNRLFASVGWRQVQVKLRNYPPQSVGRYPPAGKV